MTTTQKWENITLLITAKAEHKRKFYRLKSIDLSTADILQFISVKGVIGEIDLIKKRYDWFYVDLRQVIYDKIEEYNNHRKTMLLPDFNEIIEERNYETDCPVCFETMEDFNDSDKRKTTGINCEHPICRECYDTITEGNNKCPICRKDLINNITEVHFDTDEENTDDEEEELWNGSNERPTDNLFNGRRWYNVEEDRIECYIRPNNRWITDVNFTDCFEDGMISFIERYCSMIGDDYNCNCCGIQKTREVNEYIMNAYNNDLSLEEYNERDWMDAFDDDDGNRTICFDCRSTYLRMNAAFHNRRN